MKKKIYEYKLFWFVVINLGILAIFAGIILYTLTYKSVPINMQHEFFGQDLHTYLVWEHALTTAIEVLLLVGANIAIAKS